MATFSTIQIRESRYLFDLSRPIAQVSPISEPGEYSLATLVHWPQSEENYHNLEHIVASFRSDDVWSEDFLKAIIYQGVGEKAIEDPSAFGDRAIMLKQIHPIVPQGPYVIHCLSGQLYPVFKLYHDSLRAFVRGTLPSDQANMYKWIKGTDMVAVPSRLYSQNQRDLKTLHGMRFALKDNIDVAGLETGCGSHSWGKYHGTVSETAPFVEYLIKAGGVLVGKTRLVQFCDGLDPLEITEGIVPINPRGDEFQKPSSSSAGSACACAGYPWLDFTIGTDTGGSIRHPAGVNGVYGMRPSLGIIKSKGFVCTPLMDTVGVFARSAINLKLVTECIATEALIQIKWPRVRFRLLYSTDSSNERQTPNSKFFPHCSDDQVNISGAGKCFEEFILKLEAYLGRERERICLEQMWKQSHPAEMSDDLTEATCSIYNKIVYHDLYHNSIQPFDIAYRKCNGSHAPFIEAVTKARLEQGSQVTASDYVEAVHSFDLFGSWVNETLLTSPFSDGERREDNDTVEVPLLIYPQSWGNPQYRDEIDYDARMPGFSVYSLSYCSGCPDVTVPIGEVESNSRISDMNEYLPVSLSILAPRGGDGILLDLLSRLEEEKILRPVLCGTRAFLP